MNRRLLTVCLLIPLVGYTADIQAQCSPNCKKHRKATSKMEQEYKKPLSCQLTSPALRKRKEDIISKLKKQVIERIELQNGYRFKFKGTDEMIDEVTAFIKSERQCCDFFHFKLTITNDSVLWLDIYGQEGTKEFVTTELEM